MKPENLIRILKAGIQAVQPSVLLPHLLSDPSRPLIQDWLRAPDRFLLCVGKAALSSAESILSLVDCAGVFVLPPAGIAPGTVPLQHIHYGSHPVPDDRSVSATRELLYWLDSLADRAELLVVLSGGSSALLVAPSGNLSQEAKYQLNRLLLSCGASIHEMNTVRKHCSAVKGGQLGLRVNRLRCRVLVISDVTGNDLGVIGSGPFYADSTTFFEAGAVLEKYEVWNAAPAEVRRHITRGISGEIPETPRPGMLQIPHEIIASNETACRAAADAAKQLGYHARVQQEPVTGFAQDAAARIMADIRHSNPGTALLYGGEVTVLLKGEGVGGRNQHLALLMTERLSGLRAGFAAVGTDGVDGNSSAAGAWTDGETAVRAVANGLSYAEALARFDSYPFFESLGQSIVTGPTGTNVMDLYVALLD